MRREWEIRWRFRGDPEKGRLYVSRARTLVALSGATLDAAVTNHVYTTTEGGVKYTIQRLPDMYVLVEIDVTRLDGQRKVDFTSAVWVPEGFVLYPITAENPGGWGLPHVLVGDPEDPLREYLPENLSPGLDRSRWTPGGPLGQVLLTNKVNAGYADPDTSKSRTYIDASFMYRPRNGPYPTFAVTERGTWQAYRLSFSDYAPQSARTDVPFDTVRDTKRELHRLINEYRATLDLPPFYLPLKGYSDTAQTQVELAYETRISGHMVSEWPNTYKTANDRQYKNGSESIEDSYASLWSEGNFASSYSLEILVTFASGYEPLYKDLNGWDVNRILGTRKLITPELALDGWLTSPRHKDIVELDFQQSIDDSHAVSAHYGFRPGHVAAVFEPNGQWIQSGNRYWTSLDREIPTVSWSGFGAKNLMWETFPSRVIHGSGLQPTKPGFYNLANMPFSSRQWVLDLEIGILNPEASSNPAAAQGTPGYTTYMRNAHVERDNNPTYTSSLSPYIYMAGRTVAIAPRAGLVLAAAVKKLVFGGQPVYRLIAITHHAEDSNDKLPDVFEADFTTAPVKHQTRYCRVWWTDFASDPRGIEGLQSILCHPSTVVRVAVGDEGEVDGTDRFVDSGTEGKWRGGDRIDISSLGAGAHMLKYSSMWEFSPDADAAVCLRDVFREEDFEEAPLNILFEPPEVTRRRRNWHHVLNAIPDTAGEGSATPEVPMNSIYQQFDSSLPIGNASFVYVPGGEPKVVRLDFSHTRDDVFVSLSVRDFHSYQGDVVESKYGMFCASPNDQWRYAYYAFQSATAYPKFFRPICLYWDGSEVMCVYDVTCAVHPNWLDNRNPPDAAGGVPVFPAANSFGVIARGLVRGASLLSEEDAEALLSQVEFYSYDVAPQAGMEVSQFACVHYVDASDMVCSKVGYRVPFYADIPADFYTSEAYAHRPGIGEMLSFKLYRDPQYDFPPGFPAPLGDAVDQFYISYCDVYSVDTPRIRAVLWHNDVVLMDETLANPSKDHIPPLGYFGATVFPITVLHGALMPTRADTYFTGGYAKDRDGNWCMSFSLGTNNGSYWQPYSPPADDRYGIPECPDVHPAAFEQSISRPRSAAGPINRKGYWSSSVGDLDTLTQTPDGWSIYVRLV